MNELNKMLWWWYCPTCNHQEHWSYAMMIDQGSPICQDCDTDMIPEKEVKKMLRIESIRIKHEIETDPDLSWIGDYSDTPRDGAIDRQENGRYLGHREYRYFNPANPEYAQQEYERMEAYNRQAWGMIGVIAEAVVSYERIPGCRRLERFTSGGLWGIETDSDVSCFREVEQDELDDLRQHLEHFGVGTSEWDGIEVERLE